MAKHFDVVAADTYLTISKYQESIDQEANLDRIYVLRTTLKKEEVDPAGLAVLTSQFPT